MYECPCCGVFLNESLQYHFIFKHPFLALFTRDYYESNVNEDTSWFLMAYKEIFKCRFITGKHSAKWLVDLVSEKSRRAWHFSVTLQLGDAKYTIPRCGKLPYFLIVLPNYKLPENNDFQYRVTINKVSNEVKDHVEMKSDVNVN